MHNAWRKRAEEAEAELNALQAATSQQAPNPEAIKWIESAIRTFHKYADYHLTKDPPDQKKAINNQVEAAALQLALKLLRGDPIEKECPIHEGND